MLQKKRPKTVSRTLTPNTHFSPFTNLTNNFSLQHQYSFTPIADQMAKHTDPLNETRYSIFYRWLHSLIIHHETYNQEIQSPFNSVSVDLSPTQSTPTFVFITYTNKLTNRWTSSETRMLIEVVGKKWQALQKVKDTREKGRIWDKIIVNIQTSDVASPALKECTKASIQQKWDALLQKYRDIKDKIERTGEEAIQNDWNFLKIWIII
ncbi:hypothetical protein C1645_834552 [Glomus cerebriforme]|uniref:Myb/SANT-like DNA-binding domain-containing protein n=1 Tax=Glomus cerebriforme TaxID=658196 RepID=A0A397SFD5_9GLOM|nr:hypothetical protein C1645_834552 [Glomus cerebriforme]